MDFCCDTKYLPESPVAFFVTKSMMATMIRVVTVSGTLKMIMLTRTLTIVIALFKNCGMLWLIICLSVSMSFVYLDMISPCGCVSKYLIGSASILLNISFLILRIVPWLTLIMILLYR